jgi:uncharacterized protein (TIGR00369 family)
LNSFFHSQYFFMRPFGLTTIKQRRQIALHDYDADDGGRMVTNTEATKVLPNPRFAAAAAPSIAKLIGFHLIEYSGGEAIVELNSGPQHYNPMGTVHGGVLCDIADAAMGMAFASTLDRDQSFTTLELKINFLRPVWESSLLAKARVTSRGKTVGLVECDVVDADGRLMARASSTCLVLSGKMAEGR